MGRPGVMFYFEYSEAMQLLSDRQRCWVYDAMIVYARDGKEPEFSNEKCRIVWAMIQPRVDRDMEAYDRRVERSKKAASTRWNKEGTQNAYDAQASEASAKHGNQNQNQSHNQNQNQSLNQNHSHSQNQNLSPSQNPAELTAEQMLAIKRREKEERQANREEKKEKENSFCNAKHADASAHPTKQMVWEYCQDKDYMMNSGRFVDYYTSKDWRFQGRPMEDWRKVADAWEDIYRTSHHPIQPPVGEFAQLEKRTLF